MSPTCPALPQRHSLPCYQHSHEMAHFVTPHKATLTRQKEASVGSDESIPESDRGGGTHTSS